MSEPENFLSRWARLKRQGDQAGQGSDAAAEGEAPDGAAPETTAEASRTQASAAQSTSTAAAGGYPSNGIGAWVFLDGTLFRAVQ